MGKLVGTLLVIGAVAAAAAYLPVGGRTVMARWRESKGPADFASRSWREVAAATGLADPSSRRGPPPRGAAARPVERHSDADRRALERIVSERAGR